MKNFKNYGARIFSGAAYRWRSGICSVLLLLSMFIFGGCLSKAPLNKQTFAFSAPASPAASASANGRVLGIRTLQVAPPFDGWSFVYRTGEFSYQRDTYAEFLELPADVLAEPVKGLLRGDGCFSAVVKMNSAARPDTLMEINVSELYGDIRKPDSPSAVLAMQVILMDAKNGLPGKVILQQNYSRRIPMKSTAPAALMAGWNEALVEIFADIASDFRRQETK
jgi:cholesterol transport system auxiliary component